jgi:predicted RNA-binding protein with PIN domain
MDFDRVIVDGYSLLYRWREMEPRAAGGSLLRQRQAVMRLLEETATALARRVTVVFDGRGRKAEAGDESEIIEVLFSPGHQTADTLIERLAASSPAADRVLVVTSDRAERETVLAAGAHSMSCGVFLDRCQEIHRNVRRQTRPLPKAARGATLADVFPEGTI